MKRIVNVMPRSLTVLVVCICGIVCTRCDDLIELSFGKHYVALSTNTKDWQIDLRSTPFEGHGFSITSIDEIQSTEKAVLGYCESIAIPRIGMTPMWFILDLDSINERFFYEYSKFDSAKRALGIVGDLIPISEYYELRRGAN